MKKRITAFVFACVLVLVSALPAFAVPAPPYYGTAANERAYPLLVDDADILSDYDEQRLLTKLESISTKWDMDVAIVTIENLDNRDIEAYTDDFYDYYGYGCGDNHDGIMFLISMGDRKWHITTTGSAINIFTDAGQNYIMSTVQPKLSAGTYYDAFDSFISLCDDCIDQAENGEPYDVNNMPDGYDADGTPQDSQSKEPLPLFWIPLSIVIALVVALLVGMHYKNELKTVRFKAEANSYVVPGSMNITVSNDQFIRSHVTRTAIPKSNDNDLGSSGGGSSTHSSSSGSSHGGSSGSF